MHIGLIGGIGPAATDFYYRKLVRLAAETDRDLDMTIVHADVPTLLGHLAADDHQAQCDIYMRLTERLVAAGAENVCVTSIAGHFCIDQFIELSPLPVVDLTEILGNWLKQNGFHKVGIMGTNAVMSSGVYGKLNPVEVLAPTGDELEHVHHCYIELARTANATDAVRDVFFKAGNNMIADGAEAILLGGTDLNAVLNAEVAPFPIIDCASIHIDSIAEFI